MIDNGDARRKVIVAATYRDFERWCREHNINPRGRDAICLTRIENVQRIRGLILQEGDVAYVGDWNSRPSAVLGEIQEWIRMCTR